MKSRVISGVLALCGSIVAVSGFGAGDEEPGVKPQPLQETLVVTATRSDRSEESVPLSVTVLRAETVRETPARTLDDLLRNVPGVNLPFGNSAVQFPDTNKVSMRGLGGHRALVLVDGIPLNDAYYSYVQWNKVPLSTIDRIEVVRGASASLFGNHALGGTINVLTHPAEGRSLSLFAAGGSFGTRRADAAVEHRTNERFGLRLNATAEESDGYKRLLAADRGAIDSASWSETRNVQLRADLSPTERLFGFVKAGYFTNELSQGTGLSWTRREILDLAASAHLATGQTGDLHGAIHFQDQTFDVISSATVPGRSVEWVSNISDIPIRDTGGSLQWSQPVSEKLPLLSFGADVRRAEATDTRDIFSRAGALVAVRGNAGAQDFAGAFAQASWFPNPRLEVLASARADYWKNYDGREFGPEGTTRFAEKTKTVVDPRLSVRYAAGPVALRAAAYSAFKAPGLRDLYRTTAFAGLVILPNPDLDPETLTGVEAGVDFTAGAVTGQVNVFRNEIDDQITRITIATTPGLTFQPQNVGTSRSTGLELIAGARLGPRWSATAGYTHTDSSITDNPLDPSLEGKKTPEIPANAATLSLDFRGDALRATARASWVGASWSDASNQLPLDSHTLVDLGVTVPLRAGVEAVARLTNAFDEQYLVDYSIGRRLGEPRSIVLGLRWQRDLASR